jgi:hypothetical protein
MVRMRKMRRNLLRMRLMRRKLLHSCVKTELSSLNQLRRNILAFKTTVD